MQIGFLLVLLLFLAGCDEGVLNAITRSVHPYSLNSPSIIEQFQTDDPQSQIRFIGWREPWPGVRQYIVRVTEVFASRSQALIRYDVERWIKRYAEEFWETMDNLPKQQQQTYRIRGGAVDYHLFVYLDHQPDVLVAKGEWDSFTNQIRAEVYRASDLPLAQ